MRKAEATAAQEAIAQQFLLPEPTRVLINFKISKI